MPDPGEKGHPGVPLSSGFTDWQDPPELPKEARDAVLAKMDSAAVARRRAIVTAEHCVVGGAS